MLDPGEPGSLVGAVLRCDRPTRSPTSSRRWAGVARGLLSARPSGSGTAQSAGTVLGRTIRSHGPSTPSGASAGNGGPAPRSSPEPSSPESRTTPGLLPWQSRNETGPRPEAPDDAPRGATPSQDHDQGAHSRCSALRVIATVAPDLRAVITVLQTENARAQGVALLERLIAHGNSPLYAREASVLREELRRIRTALGEPAR
jgi:hypothetical protein